MRERGEVACLFTDFGGVCTEFNVYLFIVLSTGGINSVDECGHMANEQYR